MSANETKGNKSDHSIKLPYLYKEGSKILQSYAEKKGSLKSLVYATRQERLYKRLLALVCRAVDNQPAVDAALKAVGLLAAEPGLAVSTARLLTAELLFGAGQLSSEARPVVTVLRYADRLRAAAAAAPAPAADRRAPLPRYARVNTLLATVDDVIQQLTAEGWERVQYPPTVTYDGFISQVKSLSERQFLVDLHVPCLLVFPPGTELHRHPLYRGGQLILQDKASCLPPVVLAPTPGEHVIDACSAPGMKTSQLAAMMENKGTLVAVERDRARFGTLSTMLTKAGVSNAKLVNGDFLKLRPEDHPRVTAILLDPSCSGTGMVSREAEEAPSEERLRRLSNLQAMLLRHALSFPAVRRVVYSTCSVTEQENEQVVADTLAAHPGWRLAAAAPATWRGRARTTLPGGELCIRADPTEDLCHGFFVAAFEKAPGGEEGLNGREGKKAKRKGGEKRKSADSAMETSADGVGNDVSPAMNGRAEDGAPKQKKKKRSLSKSSQGGDAGAKALVEAGTEKQPSPVVGNEKLNGAPNEAKRKRKRKQKPKKSVSEDDEESTKETGGEKTLTGASLETKEPEEGNRKKKKQKKQSNQQVSNRASNGKSSETCDATVKAIPIKSEQKKRGISDADTKEAADSVPAKRRKNEGTGTKVLKAGKYKKSGRLSKKRRNRLKHAAALAK